MFHISYNKDTHNNLHKQIYIEYYVYQVVSYTSLNSPIPIK
jgi:hypothetical protein